MHKIHKVIAVLMLMLPLGVAAQDAVTTRAVNVRAGPDSTYPLVATLAPGTSVSVGGCISAYTWCDVYTGDVRGFVYSSYLDYPYQSNQVPIYAYGPALGLPIITFALGDYWDHYYRGRPFYGRRSYWAGRPWREPPSRFGRDWRPPAFHGNDRRGQVNRGPANRGPVNRGPAGHPQASHPPERGGPGREVRAPERKAPEQRSQGRAPEQRGGQERSRNQGFKPGRNDAQGGEAH